MQTILTDYEVNQDTEFIEVKLTGLIIVDSGDQSCQTFFFCSIPKVRQVQLLTLFGHCHLKLLYQKFSIPFFLSLTFTIFWLILIDMVRRHFFPIQLCDFYPLQKVNCQLHLNWSVELSFIIIADCAPQKMCKHHSNSI